MEGEVMTDLVGTWQVGDISSSYESDGYDVNLSAGLGYDFYAADLGVDPVMYLYDSSWNLVASNDDGGWGLDAFIDSYVAPTSDTYHLYVTGFGAGTGAYAVGAHADWEQIDTPFA
jgi:hypothetical protein